MITKQYVCSSCFFSADGNYNPNPQKNIQNLRDKGYIIRTERAVKCDRCKQAKARYSLTPIIMVHKQSYETIPLKLKKKICEIFDYRDAYTGIQNKEIQSHIPDHKFPEDRWDIGTPVDNSPTMSDEQIKQKFQLLNPQTNMQKQRCCKKCIASGKRGYPFGIKYYYAGIEDWDKSIPAKGKEAEKGCIGCGWYDIEQWRLSLNEKLNK